MLHENVKGVTHPASAGSIGPKDNEGGISQPCHFDKMDDDLLHVLGENIVEHLHPIEASYALRSLSEASLRFLRVYLSNTRLRKAANTFQTGYFSEFPRCYLEMDEIVQSDPKVFEQGDGDLAGKGDDLATWASKWQWKEEVHSWRKVFAMTSSPGSDDNAANLGRVRELLRLLSSRGSNARDTKNIKIIDKYLGHPILSGMRTHDVTTMRMLTRLDAPANGEMGISLFGHSPNAISIDHSFFATPYNKINGSPTEKNRLITDIIITQPLEVIHYTMPEDELASTTWFGLYQLYDSLQQHRTDCHLNIRYPTRNELNIALSLVTRGETGRIQSASFEPTEHSSVSKDSWACLKTEIAEGLEYCGPPKFGIPKQSSFKCRISFLNTFQDHEDATLVKEGDQMLEEFVRGLPGVQEGFITESRSSRSSTQERV